MRAIFRELYTMNTATMTDTATIVDINTAALINAIQAADLSRGKDNALPMLTTYRVELQDNKLQFITTDRYRLAVVSVDIADTAAASLAASGLFNEGGLTIDGALTAAAKIKTKAATLAVSFSAQGLSVTHDTGTINAGISDATYPKWRTLITIDAEHLSSTGNYTPQYLMDAAKACKIIGGKTPLQLTLRGLKPALLHTAGDGISLEIILMPCRTA
jgi:DNA polymerase III sliding clamp (beta) subunit (PCNA family)